jgi:microcystin-dependent protein
MSNPFVAEVRIFPFNFPPTGWAFCDGQLMPISQNTALFSLLGTTYGGDGKSNFALPNFQGMAPLQAGQGPGLSLYDLGQTSGSDTVTLLQSEMPLHAHVAQGATGGGLTDPTNNAWAGGLKGHPPAYVASNANGGNVQMSPQALSIAGSNFPHNNLMPYLTLNFCIALQGVFPPRG